MARHFIKKSMNEKFEELESSEGFIKVTRTERNRTSSPWLKEHPSAFYNLKKGLLRKDFADECLEQTLRKWTVFISRRG